MTDFYADANKPKVRNHATVYHVAYPRPSEIKWEHGYSLYIEIDECGMLDIQPQSSWRGVTYKNLDFPTRREVWDFLIEWEIAQWKRIGPEDSELFAGKALDELFAGKALDFSSPM